MSASRHRNEYTSAKPYAKLDSSALSEKQLIAVLGQLLAAANAWDTSLSLAGPLQTLSEEIDAVNAEISQLTLRNELDALASLPPLIHASGLTAAGFPSSSSPSVFSDSAVSFFRSPSGTNIIMSNVDPDAMDTGFSVSHTSFTIIPSADVASLRVTVENLVRLKDHVLNPGPNLRPTLKHIRRFHERVKDSLRIICPVLLQLMQHSKTINLLNDYNGVGWAEGLTGTNAGNTPKPPSSAAWLSLEILMNIFRLHNRQALEATRASTTLGKQVGMIEACQYSLRISSLTVSLISYPFSNQILPTS